MEKSSKGHQSKIPICSLAINQLGLGPGRGLAIDNSHSVEQDANNQALKNTVQVQDQVQVQVN